MDATLWTDAVFAMAQAEFSVTDDPLIVEKELIHVGDFSKHTEEAELKYNITEKMLDHWHKTFIEMSKDGVQVPMPLEHTRNPEAKRATLIETIRKPNKKGIQSLFGKVKYKDEKAKEALSASATSIFVPKKSGKYVMPIEHVAFTDYPVVTTLEPFTIVASLVGDEIEDDMTLRELATQAGIDPSITDEQAILLALSQKLAAIPKTAVPAPAPAVPAVPRPAMPARFSKDEEPLTGSLLGIVKQNRAMTLSRLSTGNDARITPAARKVLEDRYLTNDSLAFSHVDGASDDFDTVIDMIEKMPPLRANQSGSQAMVLSKDDLMSGEKNPLVRNAEKRAKEAAGA